MTTFEDKVQNHEQMMTLARTIHPRATVRVNSFTDTWEIVIATECSPSYNLPDSYQGTPAWDAAQNHDAGYGDELMRWGYKNGHSGECIEQVADYFNLQHNHLIERKNLIEKRLAENGIDYKTIDPQNEEHRRIWKEAQTEAQTSLNEKTRRDMHELNEKWG